MQSSNVAFALVRLDHHCRRSRKPRRIQPSYTGPRGDLVDIFVLFEGQVTKCPSLLSAVDNAFKLRYIFNVEYIHAAEHIIYRTMCQPLPVWLIWWHLQRVSADVWSSMSSDLRSITHTSLTLIYSFTVVCFGIFLVFIMYAVFMANKAVAYVRFCGWLRVECGVIWCTFLHLLCQPVPVINAADNHYSLPGVAAVVVEVLRLCHRVTKNDSWVCFSFFVGGSFVDVLWTGGSGPSAVLTRIVD